MRRESLWPGRWTLVMLPAVFSCFAFCLTSCSRQPVYQEPFIRGADVVVDASKLGHEEPIFFTHRYHGKNINFLVFKTGDRVLSFLDACASCYSSKLGYRVQDGHLVCRKCDVRYSLSNIEKGFGSCFPLPVEGYLRNGEYRIPLSRLEEFADKF